MIVLISFLFSLSLFVSLSQYNKSVDVFSYGLVLLEIAVGKADFVKLSGMDRTSYVSGKRPGISSELRETLPEVCVLIEEAWHEDPTERPEFVTIEPRLAALCPAELPAVEYAFAVRVHVPSPDDAAFPSLLRVRSAALSAPRIDAPP